MTSNTEGSACVCGGLPTQSRKVRTSSVKCTLVHLACLRTRATGDGRRATVRFGPPVWQSVVGRGHRNQSVSFRCGSRVVSLNIDACTILMASCASVGPSQALFADSLDTGDRSKWFTYIFILYLIGSVLGPTIAIIIFKASGMHTSRVRVGGRAGGRVAGGIILHCNGFLE